MSIDILVTGGRDYANKTKITQVLTLLKPDIIVHGDCSGADTLAKQWAIENNIEHCPYPANWKKHGKKAGPIRNIDMLVTFPGITVVAFPGGKGTTNCINAALQRGHMVLKVLE